MFVEHAPVDAQPAEPVALAAVPDLEPIDLHVVEPFHDEPAERSAFEPSPFEPQPFEAPVAEVVAHEVVAHEFVAHEAEPASPADDVHPVPELPVGTAEHTASPASADEPAVAPLPEPVALEPSPVELPVEPVPVAYEPAAVEQVEPIELVAPEAIDPEPWAATAAAESAEPWLAAPELPPEPDVAAAVVIHPPVSAADLPPIVAAAAKGPFWKKELSFSRKPKEPKEPKAAKAPKVPKGERAPKVKSESTPFWKKQIGGRKPAAATEVAVVAAAAAAAPTEALPAAAKVPFWKKEVSFGRKSAVPTEVAVAAATAELPAGKSLPFWKKLSFSLPALSLPTRSGGGKSGGHPVKKLVGLKIGSSQLAAARVSNNGVAEVQQLAREVLAPGIVVGGELRDPEALGDALKGFFARNKLPKKGVRLGIASNRIGVRIFDIVGVTEDKQLANAIHFRAQETLPIPLDEAVLDFRVLDETVDAEGQPVKRVLLVVVYRELVERYVSACKKAGIQLAGIDLEAFALLRSLAPPVDRGSSALVGVAIGYDRSTFAVSDGRFCEFTRVLEWGGSALNVALARTFDSTPSEVEAIKRSLSLDDSTVPPGLTTEQVAAAIDAVRRQVQSFARELVSSLQFYQNQPGSLGIGEIVLTGGTTHLPGLAAELERLIGVHVRVGDPFARVKVSKKLSETDQSGSLAVAIGLGIED
jgi:type IV pilus assembly protein PilM